MDQFVVSGGNKMYGKIEVETAKNAILPILAGSLLCSGEVKINNVTYYDDVVNMLDILRHLGAKITKSDNAVIIDTSGINKCIIPTHLTKKLRASIFFLGPLLGRLKRGKVAYPGGCAIGSRPIDIHLSGLTKLGANIIDRHGYVSVSAENMTAGRVCLPFPSVGATENLIMASVLLEGVTILSGVAKEPEVVDLCNFLVSAGAKICGIGGDELVIIGVQHLHGTSYTPIPDRIVAGTYLMMALASGGEVELSNVVSSHIASLIELFNNNTCNLKLNGAKIIVKSNGRLFGFGKIETLPHPHFPTDLQQTLSSLATTCMGNTIIVENLFENRFNHVPELTKMGAKITQNDRSIVIEGQNELYGADVEATDLRGGAGLVLAGLMANGYTTISNIHYIDRGYYKLDEKLSGLGVNIKRIKTDK